jgi:hypothetical protein
MFVPAIAYGAPPARNAVPSTRTNGARARAGNVVQDAVSVPHAAHNKSRRVIIANPLARNCRRGIGYRQARTAATCP